jgi:hypothetical protein
MMGALGWSSTVCEGHFVRRYGETASAARFLRDKDVAVADRRVLGMKDGKWGHHPVLLRFPAMWLLVVVPHSSCVRDAGAGW